MKDYASEMRRCLYEYHQAEQELITTSPELAEIDLENYSDSYKWLRYPMPDESDETVSDMILSGLEYFSNDCLAGVLVEILKNGVPSILRVNGLSIDRAGNSFRFCISGSASLEDLQTLCGQYEPPRGFEAGTKNEM